MRVGILSVLFPVVFTESSWDPCVEMLSNRCLNEWMDEWMSVNVCTWPEAASLRETGWGKGLVRGTWNSSRLRAMVRDAESVTAPLNLCLLSGYHGLLHIHGSGTFLLRVPRWPWCLPSCLVEAGLYAARGWDCMLAAKVGWMERVSERVLLFLTMRITPELLRVCYDHVNSHLAD